MMDKAGNKEVSDSFEGNVPALLLMDGKVRNAAGHDGADHANWYQLRRAAHRMQKPLAAIGATHQKVSSDPNLIAEMLDAGEFRNLSSCFESCVGARVLLIQNLWVAADLMNGALGAAVSRFFAPLSRLIGWLVGWKYIYSLQFPNTDRLFYHCSCAKPHNIF